MFKCRRIFGSIIWVETMENKNYEFYLNLKKKFFEMEQHIQKCKQWNSTYKTPMQENSCLKLPQISNQLWC